MRSKSISLFLGAAALFASACAARPGERICSPVMSFGSPVYTCHNPQAAPPPPPPPPVEKAPEPPPPPPPPARVNVTAEKIEISETVQFETDSSTIRDVSKSILQEVGQVMKDHPELVLIRVEGYTDNTGDKGHNMKLSRERAKSVKAFLVGEGIDPKRLDSEGYGETKPIADNGTEEGRLKNRRVEFLIVTKK